MPPGARVGDPTSHPGTVSGPGVTTVLVVGQPAAVLGDNHACAMPPTAGPHPPSAIVQGSGTVFIGNRPAARVGDSAACGATIVSGAVTVIIDG
jgi:uncharacterized Zn-binding protein involved in type VI secretion